MFRRAFSQGDISLVPQKEAEADEIYENLWGKQTNALRKETESNPIADQYLQQVYAYSQNSFINHLLNLDAMLQTVLKADLTHRVKMSIAETIYYVIMNRRSQVPHGHEEVLRTFPSIFPGYSFPLKVFRGVNINESSSKWDALEELEVGKQLTGRKMEKLAKSWSTDNQLMQAIEGQDEGAVITSTNFWSTSLIAQRAMFFTNIDSGCCLLEIDIPAYTPCAYVSALSSHFEGPMNEYEVLLFPGTRFILKGRKNGRIRLHVTGF
jgi:hypothetical protein